MYSVTRRPSETSNHSSCGGDTPLETMPIVPGPKAHSTEMVPPLDFPAPLQDTWELPFLTVDQKPRNSVSSAVQRPKSASSLAPPTSDTLGGTDSASNRTSLSIQSTVKSEDGELDIDKTVENDKVKGKDSGSLPKLRRGLQKTLREAHVPGQKVKKPKDFASEAAGSIEKNGTPQEEGLTRGTGRFTLHGLSPLHHLSLLLMLFCRQEGIRYYLWLRMALYCF